MKLDPADGSLLNIIRPNIVLTFSEIDISDTHMLVSGSISFVFNIITFTKTL